MEVFCKKEVLKILQKSQENTCVSVSSLIRLQAYNFIIKYKRASDTGVSCEFYEISQNTFFTEHLPWLLLWGPKNLAETL